MTLKKQLRNIEIRAEISRLKDMNISISEAFNLVADQYYLSAETVRDIWYNKNKKGGSMSESIQIKPGEKVPDSGIYESNISKRRATLVKGEPAPPAPTKGEYWIQVIDTNPGN